MVTRHVWEMRELKFYDTRAIRILIGVFPLSRTYARKWD